MTSGGGSHAREVLSFHCVPHSRSRVDDTTITAHPLPLTSTGHQRFELLEFQFGGDSEAHGVPR